MVATVLGSVLIHAAVASNASAAPPQGPSLSPSQLLTTSLASASGEGSVRVTVHFFSGKVTGELVQDSARLTAEQTVAIGKERVSIVLIGRNAYFVANKLGLSKYFGLSPALAATLSGHWISVTPADWGYQSVTAGLSLAAALGEVRPTGHITEAKRKSVNNQLTIAVSGAGTSSVPRTTLFIAATGRPLPVEAVSSSGDGKTAAGEIVTFSRSGEKVRTPKPTDAIPFSTLSLGSPSAG